LLRRLLARLADAVARHPRRVLLLTILPALLLGLDTLRHPVDLAFTGIVPRENPLMQRYLAAAEEVNFGARMPLLLEGPEEVLDEALEVLVPVLEARPEIVEVYGEVPLDWLEDRAPYLVERELFDAWLGLAMDPSDADHAQALARGLGDLQAEVEEASSAQEGTRLLILQQTLDPMAAPLGDAAYFDFERTLEETLEPFGVEGVAAGITAIAAQDQVRTFSRVQWLTPISFVLVMVWLVRVERRPLWLGSLALPMLLALGATLGIVGELLGLITIMESFFGVMVFGLGIDFGLHLSVRLREERAAGRSFPEALRVTWEGTGRGVVAGGLTTAGAFAVMALAPDPSTRHLGVSGAVGLTVCLVLMLTLLPATWAWLERRRGADVTPRRPLEVPGLRRFARHAVAHPWLHLGVAVAVVVTSLAGSSRFHFETDLTKVFNRQVPAVSALHRLQELYGVNTGPWIATADDLEEARRLTAAFEATPEFPTVLSVSQVIGADASERHEVLVEAAEALRTRRATLEALVPIAFVRRGELLGAIQLLAALQEAAELGPPTLEDLPAAIRAPLVTATGKLLVYAYTDQATLDGRVAKAERAAAEAIAPGVVSFQIILELLMAADAPWVLPVLIGVLVFVTVVLVVDLRRPRWILLALVPVLCGTAVAWGGLCWTGHAFNIMTITVVPLIIGLGVDDGIHVVHRILEDPGGDPAEAAASVGQAIVMTTLTTCTSFAVMLGADHPGLEGMALVMLIGLPACLLASVSLVPALAVLTSRRG